MPSTRRLSRRLSFGAIVVAAALVLVGPAGATIRYGPLEISGNFETQNIIRHPEITKFQFVQNRNTFRLRLDWDIKERRGKLFDKFDAPWIKEAHLFFFYRGVYDGFYDLAPGHPQVGQTRFDDLIGGPIEGNPLGSCLDTSTGRHVPCPAGAQPLPDNLVLRQGLYSRFRSSSRSRVKRENRIREVYVDLTLADAPLSFRIGRQQVIWGESDNFRIMDIWNPLDVTHHLMETWDRIRQPLWLAKMLWDMGRVGPLSNTFLEVVYNPFDFQNGNKLDWLPRPWAVPLPNPLRAGQVLQDPVTKLFLSPVFDLRGTTLRKGAFRRSPEDASEIGARFHGVTPQGLEFAVAYLYGRARLFGAAKPLALKFDPVVFPNFALAGRPCESPRDVACTVGRFAGQPVIQATLSGEIVYPYTHIFGLTGNYFEGEYTQAVLRWEMTYAMGQPFHTVKVEDPLGPALPPPLGFTKRDVWTGMVGFDRPTWIRFLNPKATWFISGQFFWNYTLGSARDLREATYNSGEPPYFTPDTGPLHETSGVGRWENGFYAGAVERVQQFFLPLHISDNVKQWELLMTLAATTFYQGGTLVPFLVLAVDPVNRNMLAQWSVDWFYSNDFIIRLEQRFFSTLGQDRPSNDPWFAGGRLRRRDETVIRLTYQY